MGEATGAGTTQSLRSDDFRWSAEGCWADETPHPGCSADVLSLDAEAFPRKAPQLAGGVALAFQKGGVRTFELSLGDFSNVIHAATQASAALDAGLPGKSPVPVSGKVFDVCKMVKPVDLSLGSWLATGRLAQGFEKRSARRCELRSASLIGPFSSLAAPSCLTSPKLGERRLKPRDEVIPAAAGFPTTVNPIVQIELVPVLMDVQVPTCDVATKYPQEALSPKAGAAMVVHAPGNPFDVNAVAGLAKRQDLWFIEDCCDPVLTDTLVLKTLIESFRDCWYEPGKDNTCGNRIELQLGDLRRGYGQKYTFSRIGYNPKVTDTQTTVRLTQLNKPPCRPERMPGVPAHRHAVDVRRRPDPSAGISRSPLPYGGRPQRFRLRKAQGVLELTMPGACRGDGTAWWPLSLTSSTNGDLSSLVGDT
jgi:hypothetical protein